MDKSKRRLQPALAICIALASLYNLAVSHRNFPSDLDQKMQFVSVTSRMTKAEQPYVEKQSPLKEVIPNGNVNKESWENEHNLVHIILTRFMQHQPNLLHLGRARLELFKSFCLPTMLQQTNKQFLWIIRVDPMLHPLLKAEFLQTLLNNTNQINVVVVGSNTPVDDGHFRHPNAIADINSNSLWFGNLDLVRSYHQAAQNHPVIETGLDADDGLALTFVQDLQRQTALVAELQEKQSNTTARNSTRSSSWWKIWCVNGYAEWQFYSEYMNSSYGHMSENNGATASKERVCITPGLTRVSTADYRKWKKSKGTKKEGGQYPGLREWGHRFFVDHYFIQPKSGKVRVNEVGGWSYLPVPGSVSNNHSYVPVIRARTPTSAGMKGVVVANVTSRPWTQQEQDTWLKNVEWFGLSMDQILQSRYAIRNNLSLVLEDALQGQCSEGHSCLQRAPAMLEYLKTVGV